MKGFRKHIHPLHKSSRAALKHSSSAFYSRRPPSFLTILKWRRGRHKAKRHVTNARLAEISLFALTWCRQVIEKFISWHLVFPFREKWFQNLMRAPPRHQALFALAWFKLNATASSDIVAQIILNYSF
jgi:hypothetical protein